MNIESMKDIKETFEGLFYEIAVGNFDLRFIVDLENFCKDFAFDQDYKRYEIEAKSVMSMIYSDNEVFDKSFNLDLQFVRENSIEHPKYSVIIDRISKISSILMRTDAVKEYVSKFILNGSKSEFITKLTLLDWYTTQYPREIAYNDDFEKVVSEVLETLWAPAYDELPLAERIKTVAILKKDCTYMVRQFQRSYHLVAPELRSAVLDEYLNKTPLKFYQDIIRQAAEKY